MLDLLLFVIVTVLFVVAAMFVNWSEIQIDNKPN
jgi:hypothetical protein